MAVHLTRIYTKAGDAGMTRLSNNEQVPKTDPRIAAYADREVSLRDGMVDHTGLGLDPALPGGSR